MKKEFSVSDENAGTRLDLFLVKQIDSGSRSAVRRLIDSGAVTLNGKAPKASQKLKAGDRLIVQIPEQQLQEQLIVPWNFPVRILLEDDYLIAVDKPSGIVTHPGAGNREHTLAQAMLHHRPEIAHVGNPMRPGIVHRLDKETSGVMLFAKTQAAYLGLTTLFKDRKIEKHYRALAFGTFRNSAGKIDKTIGRDPNNRKKMSVRSRKSRSAVTHYRVMKQLTFFALLDVRIETGRTHQIRIHLSSENHPIVGDELYGGGNWNRITDAKLRSDLKGANFFGLHSFSLDFQHPFSGKPLHIETPIPDSWTHALGGST